MVDINKKFFFNLLSTFSPSGYETNAVNVFDDYCKEFANKVYSDRFGNSCFAVGSGGTPILLSGHIDEIGLQVQNIDEKGFIHFIKLGGIDPKVLLGANVVIMTSNGNIRGVIGKKPIHIEHRKNEMDNVIKITDMKIDCGFENKEDALKHVSVGDAIVVDSPIIELGEHRIASRGLDDKVGVFITAEVLKELSKHELKKFMVFGAACTQEEVGGHGAKVLASAINPSFSIDYDVTFATDDDYVSANEWGDIKLGSGGAIAHGSDCSPKLVTLIKEVCKKDNIPFQPFSVTSGGTDTIKIRTSAKNAATTLLSIPLRSMHTQVECVDYRDIQSLIDMTVKTILALDKD